MTKPFEHLHVQMSFTFGVSCVFIFIIWLLFTEEQLISFTTLMSNHSNIWFRIFSWGALIFGIVSIGYSLAALFGYGSKPAAFFFLSIAAFFYCNIFVFFLGLDNTYFFFILIFGFFTYLVYERNDPLDIRKNE